MDELPFEHRLWLAAARALLGRPVVGGSGRAADLQEALAKAMPDERFVVTRAESLIRDGYTEFTANVGVWRQVGEAEVLVFHQVHLGIPKR